MIITYFRSSSFTSWDMCPFKTYLVYCLGLPDFPHNNKSDKGNLVHKALELLARKKLAEQNGELLFAEDEMKKEWAVSTFTPELALQEAWDYYTKVRAPQWDWSDADWKDSDKWMRAAMTASNGLFNPLNRNILQPEQYFDFTIDQPWAKYTYKLPDGTKLEGQLALKGTVDLVTMAAPNTLEYLDWKTGLRKCWATGEKKDWKKLRKDPQLRIYYYALARLYPDIEHIIMSIFYTQDGGGFSLDYSRDDIPDIEAMLKARFDMIRDCEMPPRVIHNRAKNWQCKYICHYGRHNQDGTNETICNYMHGELKTLGMDRVTAKHGNIAKMTNYGEGGGRTSKV